MKNKITIRNTVTKTGDSLIVKARTMLKEEGILPTANKAIGVLGLLAKRLFCEYIPLHIYSLFSKKGEIVKTVQGSKMILNLNDVGISRELAAYGVHEANSTAEVKRIITPGMKILEVGANIGYYALLETRLAGPTGHLYAMEPSPFNFNLLERNLKLNGLNNYDLYETAAGAEKGTAKFLLSGRSNLSTFIEREDLTGEEVDVAVTTLDEFLADKQVDFIRMDVEGYEGEILKGVTAVLSKAVKPRFFFIEVHSDLLQRKGSSTKEIIDFLGTFGYEVRKSFWRGHSDTVVTSAEALLAHPLCEIGYWETFFELQ